MKRSSNAASILQRRTPVDPAIRAQYLLSRGFTFAQLEQFPEQAVATRNALTLLLDNPSDHHVLMAKTAHALASLAREVPVASPLELLNRATEQIVWTRKMRSEHFQLLRTIGWNYALQGSSGYVRAFEFLGRSRDVASTPGQRMLAHLDHAFVADFANQPHSFAAELTLAHAEYGKMDWIRPLHDEDLEGLILAAELHARHNPARAHFYLEQVIACRCGLSRRSGLAHGRGIDAMIAAASARVHLYSDQHQAIREAVEALEIFERMNYAWRGTRVALQLHDMTGLDRWLDRARSMIVPYPGSSLAEEVVRRTGLGDLRPAQEHVLCLLQSGLRPAEIARELRRSSATVKHHVQTLFRRYDVDNMVALLARAPHVTLPGTVVSRSTQDARAPRVADSVLQA